MKTVYTAIFGNYDDLKEPLIISKGWKYIVFTDQELKSDVWEVVKVPVLPCGPVKTARYYKIMFHQHIETRFSLWIDATFIINTDLNEWWKGFISPFSAMKHPNDDCLYDEIYNCARMGKGELKQLKKQLTDYKSHGIPKHNGLIASGILMREKTKKTIDFCNMWWAEVLEYSSRDQVAYGFANYYLPGIVNTFEYSYMERAELMHIPHLHKVKQRNMKYEAFRKHQRANTN